MVVGVGIWWFVYYETDAVVGAIETAADTMTDAVTGAAKDSETVHDVIVNLLPDAVGPYVLQIDEDPPTPHPAVTGTEEEPVLDDPPNSEPTIPSLIRDYLTGPTARSTDADFVAEIERHIYLLTNAERESRGLDLLQRNMLVDSIARAHSQDMADRDYFSHVTPEGLDPTNRGLKAGYDCTKDYGTHYTYGLAENIFWYGGIPYSHTAEDIAGKTVTDWMNSPGHRGNILESSYDRIGVGVAFDDNERMYATQNFC